MVTRKKSRWRRKVKAGGGAKRMQKGRRREKAGWRRKEEAPEVASASPSQSLFLYESDGDFLMQEARFLRRA